MGAKPLALSNAIILQAGFPIADLDRIMKSLNETCEEVDVAVITGDTKVMEQGKIDGIVMVTTGIGIAKKGEIIRDSTLEVGDKIIVTGSLGDHGMSLMSFREGFGFENDLKLLKQLKLKNMEKMQLLLVKLLKEIMLLLKLQLVGKEYLKLQ